MTLTADADQQAAGAGSPGPGSPLRTGLRAQLPEGWSYKETITLLHSENRANVIVSTEPVGDDIDSNRYAQNHGDLLRGFEGYKEVAFEPMEVFGRFEGYLRRFEWHPRDGLPVTQLQLYCVVAGRGLTATATTPSSDFPEFELQLMAVLEGLVFDPPVSAVAEPRAVGTSPAAR